MIDDISQWSIKNLRLEIAPPDANLREVWMARSYRLNAGDEEKVIRVRDVLANHGIDSFNIRSRLHDFRVRPTWPSTVWIKLDQPSLPDDEALKAALVNAAPEIHGILDEKKIETDGFEDAAKALLKLILDREMSKPALLEQKGKALR